MSISKRISLHEILAVSFLLAISGLMFVIYLPVAALVTLGLLALWNRLHPPKFWQVLVATTCVGFLPWLLSGLPEEGGVGLHVAISFLAYAPVLIPAVLWALQRRSTDGEFSSLAKRAGSLLVAYIILVVLIVPALVIGLTVLSNLRG
jgi:hypothetical protein